MPGLGSIAELSSWFVLVPLMAILVGPWGAEGVATALTISAAFSLAVLVVLFRRAERRMPEPTTLEEQVLSCVPTRSRCRPTEPRGNCVRGGMVEE